MTAAAITLAQKTWLNKNKSYMRTSHIPSLRFSKCGTLFPDGTFVATSPGRPVMDGNGAFGVGVPIPMKRRR